MSSSIKDGKDGDMKKFMFDMNDFDKTEPETTEPAAPTYSEEQLVLAKTQSYTQGRADGVKETQDAQEARIIELLDAAGAQIAALVAAEEKRELRHLLDAARLSMRVTRKMLPALATRFPLDEIERLVTDSIAARKDEPRISITVPAAHYEALKDRVDRIALEKGFTGKLLLAPDETLGGSDCRIEWADGGAERLYDYLYSLIEDEFAKA